MLVQRSQLNAEDRIAYATWRRRMLVAYGAFVLFGIAVVAVQGSTRVTNVATSSAAAGTR
jgi:hypothetical protein